MDRPTKEALLLGAEALERLDDPAMHESGWMGVLGVRIAAKQLRDAADPHTEEESRATD